MINYVLSLTFISDEFGLRMGEDSHCRLRYYVELCRGRHIIHPCTQLIARVSVDTAQPQSSIQPFMIAFRFYDLDSNMYDVRRTVYVLVHIPYTQTHVSHRMLPRILLQLCGSEIKMSNLKVEFPHNKRNWIWIFRFRNKKRNKRNFSCTHFPFGADKQSLLSIQPIHCTLCNVHSPKSCARSLISREI